MIDDAFLSKLAATVGSVNVLRSGDLAGREAGIDPSNLDAELQVVPRTTAQISAVLALCQSFRTGDLPGSPGPLRRAMGN